MSANAYAKRPIDDEIIRIMIRMAFVKNMPAQDLQAVDTVGIDLLGIAEGMVMQVNGESVSPILLWSLGSANPISPVCIVIPLPAKFRLGLVLGSAGGNQQTVGDMVLPMAIVGHADTAYGASDPANMAAARAYEIEEIALCLRAPDAYSMPWPLGDSVLAYVSRRSWVPMWPYGIGERVALHPVQKQQALRIFAPDITAWNLSRPTAASTTQVFQTVTPIACTQGDRVLVVKTLSVRQANAGPTAFAPGAAESSCDTGIASRKFRVDWNPTEVPATDPEPGVASDRLYYGFYGKVPYLPRFGAKSAAAASLFRSPDLYYVRPAEDGDYDHQPLLFEHRRPDCPGPRNPLRLRGFASIDAVEPADRVGAVAVNHAIVRGQSFREQLALACERIIDADGTARERLDEAGVLRQLLRPSVVVGHRLAHEFGAVWAALSRILSANRVRFELEEAPYPGPHGTPTRWLNARIAFSGTQMGSARGRVVFWSGNCDMDPIPHDGEAAEPWMWIEAGPRAAPAVASLQALAASAINDGGYRNDTHREFRARRIESPLALELLGRNGGSHV